MIDNHVEPLTSDREVAALELELERERLRAEGLRRQNAALRDAIIRAPASNGKARALSQLATAAHGARDFDEAAGLLRSAVAVEPGNFRLWVALARARRMAGNLGGASIAVLKALELQPGHQPAQREAGEIAARALDARALTEAIRRYGDLRRCSAPQLHDVLRWAEMTDDHALLRRALEPLAAHAPDSPVVRAVSARLFHQAGDGEGANAAVSESVEAAVTFDLAVGQPRRALERLTAETEPDPDLLKRVAGALRQCGELRTALAVLALATGLPGAGEAVEHDRDRVDGELLAMSTEWRLPTLSPQRYDAVTGRILHLLGRSKPHIGSGYAVRTQYVLEAQRAAGLDPVAATQLGFPAFPGASDVDEVGGIAYHRLCPGEPTPTRADARLAANLEELDRLVGELRPAALHPASDYLNARLALALRERRGVPVVYEARGFWEETWLAGQPDELVAMETDAYLERLQIENACMIEADHVVTLAEVMRDAIIARGVPANRITIVPNAVDSEAFHPIDPDPALARRLGLDDADAVLGYVSSFSPYEGIEYLLRATALLRERGRRVKVLLVGDGREREALEAAAAELQLGDAAVFTGRVAHDEVLSYYALIDVFVVPRTADRVSRLVTPLKPYEAMATGRVLVVSDVDALREVVDDGRLGRCFRAQDAEHLADVVEPLIEDPTDRIALATTAREWILTERTWRANGDRYRTLYEKLGVA